MPGKLFAIEGADASGKYTQARLLLERLEKGGKEAVLISFPRDETFSGKLVRQYLRGEFGSLQEVRPELAALLYSIDRYNAMPFIEEQLGKGKIVVCDRYIASNIAHQAAKFKGGKQQEFIKWIEAVEGRLPQPDLTLFLDLPVGVSTKLMQKEGRKKDIHEADLAYLEATRQVYLGLCKKPDWIRVDCASGAGIKPREEIHKTVWKKLQEYL